MTAAPKTVGQSRGRSDCLEDGFVERVRDATMRLLTYCRSQDWAGYDPYDALNSRWFDRIPLVDFRWMRIALTQFNKRCPVNLRPLLAIPKTRNAKGTALAVAALIRLENAGLVMEKEIETLGDALLKARSPGISYWCWGYSFPWQTRTLLVPRGAANLVCTCFVGNALLDLFDRCQREEYLTAVMSAADYILNELYYTEGPAVASFSYPRPDSRSKVHNANFLAAALLARICKISGETKFLEPALRAASYSASRQQSDGSWLYGELPTQRWIDNFHTGFNLCALADIEAYAGTDQFRTALDKGLEFYRNHFFEADGAPRYFHDRTYPFDAHCVAQSIITLVKLALLDSNNVALAKKVCEWALDNMLDASGCFYYQKRAWFINKIPYMRWSQTWMLLALSCLMSCKDEPVNHWKSDGDGVLSLKEHS